MKQARFFTAIMAFAALAQFLQCASTSTSPLNSPAGTPSIASLEKISLGGVEQWILLRGYDTSKPLLLKLHGGPGQAEMATAPFNSFLERDFIVVEWDQRGAGKSHAAFAPESAMTIGQFVADTTELSRHLLQRFQRDKLLLVGHSWGSVIALKAAQAHPELFYAVATTGQIISVKDAGVLSHTYLLAAARSAGNSDAEKDLTENGPPPYSDARADKKFATYIRYLQEFKADWHGAEPMPRVRLMLSAPEYAWSEKLKFTGAAERSFRLLYPQLARVDLRTEIRELRVPIYFALGRHDHLQPGELAERYLQSLKAPRKIARWFENSGHFPFLEENEAFAAFLREIPARYR